MAACQVHHVGPNPVGRDPYRTVCANCHSNVRKNTFFALFCISFAFPLHGTFCFERSWIRNQRAVVLYQLRETILMMLKGIVSRD
jgi:hypothetical protein